MTAVDVVVVVDSVDDIVAARQAGRELAGRLGFSLTDITLIATAISEVARNIVQHAKCGEIILTPIRNGNRQGISLVARDEGPGIADVTLALQYGYSTRKGLGVGLPGAKWLMDEFDIDSKVGKGTTVTMKKWLG